MSTVTVSPANEITLPEGVLDALSIKPGQQLEVLNVNGSIRLVPIRPPGELRGSLKGMKSEGVREKQDRPL